MELLQVWITVIGLFIGGYDETFFLEWSDVSSFGLNDDKMKLTVMLDSGKLIHWETDDREFYKKVKRTIYREVQTTVMLRQPDCDVKVEVVK